MWFALKIWRHFFVPYLNSVFSQDHGLKQIYYTGPQPINYAFDIIRLDLNTNVQFVECVIYCYEILFTWHGRPCSAEINHWTTGQIKFAYTVINMRRR